jgi:outer membrane immunogenic protein
MHRIICAAVAAAGVVGIASIAFAADMPVKAPPRLAQQPVATWAGFYVGANIGGYWGRESISTTTGNCAVFFSCPDLHSRSSLKPSGVIGGVQAGYNWQSGNFVLGVEGDLNWLGGKTSRVLVLPPALFVPGDFFSYSIHHSFLATLRPRVGVTVGQTLFYATGGLAVARFETVDSLVLGGGITPSTARATTTRAGWTAGGGVEYALANNWTAKLEYLHVGFDNFNTVIPESPLLPGTGTATTVHHKYSADIVRLGLNYRLK